MKEDEVQVNENDSLLVYSYKAKKLEKENEKLSKEILNLKKQLSNAEFQLEIERTNHQQAKIDIELQNRVLEEENKRLSNEVYRLEVSFIFEH